MRRAGAAQRARRDATSGKTVARAVACMLALTFSLARAAGQLPDAEDTKRHARSLIEAGRLADARPDLERLVARQPDDPEARYLLGLVALQLQDSRAATTHLRAVVRARPHDALALKLLARALAAAGATTEAISYLERATGTAPRDAEAWSLLGRVHQDGQRFAAAVGALERSLQLDPADVPAWIALANAYVGLGRSDAADETFRRAVEVNARAHRPRPDAHASYAIFLLRLDRRKEAEAEIRRAAALDPDVILGSRERQARLYYGLRKVAPTVMSEGGGGGGGAWKLNVRLFGEGLGRTNAAERLLIGWDSTAADARRRIGPRKPSVAVVRAVRGGLRLAGLDSFPGRLLADAGLGDGLGEDSWRPLSPAQLKRLNADVVLVSAPPGVEVPAVAGALRVDDALWWDGEGLLAARAAMRQLVHAAVR